MSIQDAWVDMTMGEKTVFSERNVYLYSGSGIASSVCITIGCLLLLLRAIDSDSFVELVIYQVQLVVTDRWWMSDSDIHVTYAITATSPNK